MCGFEATLIPVLSFEFVSLEDLFEKVSLEGVQLPYFQQSLGHDCQGAVSYSELIILLPFLEPRVVFPQTEVCPVMLYTMKRMLSVLPKDIGWLDRTIKLTSSSHRHCSKRKEDCCTSYTSYSLPEVHPSIAPKSCTSSLRVKLFNGCSHSFFSC